MDAVRTDKGKAGKTAANILKGAVTDAAAHGKPLPVIMLRQVKDHSELYPLLEYAVKHPLLYIEQSGIGGIKAGAYYTRQYKYRITHPERYERGK